MILFGEILKRVYISLPIPTQTVSCIIPCWSSFPALNSHQFAHASTQHQSQSAAKSLKITIKNDKFHSISKVETFEHRIDLLIYFSKINQDSSSIDLPAKFDRTNQSRLEVVKWKIHYKGRSTNDQIKLDQTNRWTQQTITGKRFHFLYRNFK